MKDKEKLRDEMAFLWGSLDALHWAIHEDKFVSEDFTGIILDRYESIFKRVFEVEE